MSDYQSIDTTVITTQQPDTLIALSDLKSLFYQLNAKPDTEVRLLPKGKTLDLSDIRSINEQVVAKIENHDVIGKIASINFILSNRKIKDFATWAEFERERWETINDRVESISVTWDMSLRMPQYELPQRHSLKLRIGNAIPLKDMFQIVLASDDISELMETESHGICKVDFVNSIIANELLNIVSNWHDGLSDSPELVSIQKFIKKWGRFVTEVIRYLIPILLLILTCSYSEIVYGILSIENEISMNSLQRLLIFSTIIFSTGIIVGSRVENWIDRKINKIQEFPSFKITRGDEKFIEELEKKNNSLTNQIISRISWILIGFLITSGLRFLIPMTHG
jgi:hypothetical protein